MSNEKLSGKDLKTMSAPPSAAPLKAMSLADFESTTNGETFGGTFKPIELEIGTVSGKLIYVKDSKIVLPKTGDDGKTISETIMTPLARLNDDPESPLMSLPIGTIFKKAWDESHIQPGQCFWMARYPDSKKKSGKGAGNAMKVYALKLEKTA